MRTIYLIADCAIAAIKVAKLVEGGCIPDIYPKMENAIDSFDSMCFMNSRYKVFAVCNGQAERLDK